MTSRGFPQFTFCHLSEKNTIVFVSASGLQVVHTFEDVACHMRVAEQRRRHVHDIRSSKSVSWRHSTVPMCRLPETAHRHRCKVQGYLDKYAFSPLRCIVDEWWGSPSSKLVFTWIDTFLEKIGLCAKSDFHISASVTLTFDLLISKLLSQLLLTWVTSSLSLNVVRFFRVNGGHGQTDWM